MLPVALDAASTASAPRALSGISVRCAIVVRSSRARRT
jgi:hypothetical protein